MKRRHQRTLELILARPALGNLQWREIEALFKEMGANVEEREGSRILVRLFGERRVFHRPHPSPRYGQGRGCVGSPVAIRERGETMMNVMDIDGMKAVIRFDPEIGLFRGEFVGLNGGADFYAADVEGLRREGAESLRVFLEACQEDEAEPFKAYSGKFVLRLPPDYHRAAAIAAQAEGLSLNHWAAKAIRAAIENGERA